MQNKSVNMMLRLGMCLLLLSGKVMCGPIANGEEEVDLLMSQVKSQIDGVFNEMLTCPPNTADEVKSCVLREAEKATDDLCTGFKLVWDCYKAGLIKCQDGPRVMGFVGPSMNDLVRSNGCPTIYYGSSNGLWQANSSIHVILVLVAFVFLIIGIIVRLCKNKHGNQLPVQIVP